MRSEAPLVCGVDTLVRVSGVGRRSLRPHPSHRIQHAIRRVHAVQILGDFGAKESASNGMLGIALDFSRAAVFDSDQDAAGVRAVVRAGGMDDVLHPRIIKDSIETGALPRLPPRKKEMR